MIILNNVSCGAIAIPAEFPKLISGLFVGIKIVVPIILVIICMIDFGRAITTSNDNNIKSAVNLVKNRFIVAILCFIVPSIVQFVVSFAGGNNSLNCVNCLLNGIERCNIIESTDLDERIHLNEENIILNVGETYELTVNTENNVIWKSSNPNVVTVINGKVTSKTEGTAVVSATVGDVTLKCTVTVKNNMYMTEVQSIKIINVNTNMVVGDTQKIDVNITPTSVSDKNISYESSNEQVIIINGKGNIIAKQPGKSTITVSSVNGKKDSIQITVVNKITDESDKILHNINVTKNDIYIDSYQLDDNANIVPVTYQFEVTTEPKNTINKLNYSSSNIDVASIDSNGKITAINEGAAIITVTSDNGISVEKEVNVRFVAKDSDSLLRKVSSEYNKKIKMINEENMNEPIKINVYGINGLDNVIYKWDYLYSNDQINYYTWKFSLASSKKSELTNYLYEFYIVETFEQEKIVSEYLSKVAKKITKECNESTDSNYCKASQIRNWITKNMIYGKMININGIDMGSGAYATIYTRKTEDGYVGVCQAYSTIFYLMANSVGLKTKLVPAGAHIWNISLINGKWYYSDITWDDVNPQNIVNGQYYDDKYLLFGENKLKQTHANYLNGLKSPLTSTLDGYPISIEDYKPS